MTRTDMAAKLRAEGLVSLSQAAALIPADNHKGHASPGSLLRWIVSGRRKIKLEACRERGEWWTSLAALNRFLHATNSLRAASGG